MRRLVAVLRRPMALSLALVGLLSARVEGQITAGMASMVDILAAPLSGIGSRALQFGVIVPGTTSVVVLPRSISGGEFRLAGVRNRKSVDISFTLPTALTGPGGASIPLSFDGNYAGLCEIDTSGVCVPASYTTWNPVTTTIFHDLPTRYQPGRKLYTYDTYQVYIGGVASPGTTQRQGTYTGSIGVLVVVN